MLKGFREFIEAAARQEPRSWPQGAPLGNGRGTWP